MKILIVSMTPSSPITSGNRKWIVSQAQFLKERGHNVYFLYVSCPVLFKQNSESHVISEMKTQWGNNLIVYKAGILSRIKLSLSYKMRKLLSKGYHTCDDLCPFSLPLFVKRLQKNKDFDACVVNYYWLTKIFDNLVISKKVLNTHDCFSYKDMHAGKYAWMTTTPNEEAKAMQRCNYIFALQETEAHFFQHLSPKSHVLDVFCFFKFIETPIVGNHNILFLSGNNQYNINGLDWFMQQVFPQLIKKYPDAKLVVGGAISEYARGLSCDNIQILGFVDAPIHFFMLGDVYINPTYEGTGLKIKTFESISFDKITVTRIHSTEGIYLPHSAPILASDNPEQWIYFFEQIWENNELISIIKKKNKEYMHALNQHIDEQYSKFEK